MFLRYSLPLYSLNLLTLDKEVIIMSKKTRGHRMKAARGLELFLEVMDQLC